MPGFLDDWPGWRAVGQQYLGPHMMQGLDNVANLAGFFSPATDVRDAMQTSGDTMSALRGGDYAGAAQAALWIPVSMMGAMLPGRPGAARLPTDIRRPSNVSGVLGANFARGRIVGDEMIATDSLNGGVRLTDPGEKKRVKALADRISGPDGFFERIIVGPGNNVIEGQHRLEAARMLGIKEIPAVRLADAAEGLPVDKMKAAIMGAGAIHPDHINQIMERAADAIRVAGSPKAAMEQYEMPSHLKKYWEAALMAASKD